MFKMGFLISKKISWYQKLFLNIKKSNFWYKKNRADFVWYKKNRLNFWYQEFDFFISRIRLFDIKNSILMLRNIFCNSLNCTETTIPMYLWPSVLMGVGVSGCRVVGLSGRRTIGLSDYRVVGLPGCRTIGSLDYRAVGLSGRRNIRLEPLDPCTFHRYDAMLMALECSGANGLRTSGISHNWHICLRR